MDTATPARLSFLDRWFGVTASGSTVRTEAIAGVTTFLTMVYIVFVNPTILASTGMDKGAVFVATCLAAAFGSLVMGLLRQLPHRAGAGHGAQRLLHLHRGVGLRTIPGRRRWRPCSAPACCSS